MSQITEGIKSLYWFLDSEEKAEIIKHVILNGPAGMKLRDLFSEKELNRTMGYDLDLISGQMGEIGLLEGKYEVKRDFMASETGNVAIEVECRGRPSGITTTEAHFWHIWLSGSEYQDEVAITITVDRLKRLAEISPHTYGGDDNVSLISLVKIYDLMRPNKWIEGKEEKRAKEEGGQINLFGPQAR